MTHMLRIPRPLTKVAILVDAYASLGKKRIPESSLWKPPSSAIGNFAVDRFAFDKRNVQSEKLTPGNPRRLLAKEASAQIIPNPSKHHQEASPHKLYRSSSVPLVHPSLNGKLVIPGGSDGPETKEYSVKLMPQSNTDKTLDSDSSYLYGLLSPRARRARSSLQKLKFRTANRRFSFHSRQ
jgi:hypothetical protein